jgi:CPA1 family monovalent cation:H+ antiporter
MSSVPLIVFGLVTLLGLVSLLPPLASRLKLPYSVLLALAGCALGILIQIQPEAKSTVAVDLLDALKQFEISAEAILVIFLPALLFEAALAVDLRRMMEDIAPILTMAVVAVVICTLVVGVSLSLASDYGLLSCLLLGSIVATTDPAAVIGIFKEVGAPRRLLTLVEGEALLNDAAAIALFSMLIAMLLDPASASPTSAIRTFLTSAIGGAVVGAAMGFATTQLFRILGSWPRAEITLTIVLAYLSYFLTDHYLHLSGVVACVVAGLVIGTARRTRLSVETAEQLEGAWGQVGFWANSLIFLLAAMFVPRFVGEMHWRDAGLIALLYLATILARALSVFGLLPGLERFGLMQRIDYRYKSVILWGGLRGAVSLALALAVTENEALPLALRDFLAAAVTGFVLATLFVNGASLRGLIRLLQLNRLSAMALGVRDRAAVMTLAEVRVQVAEAAERGRIDRGVVDAVLGDLDGRLAIERSASASLGAGDGALGLRQTIRVGLTVLTARETARYLDLLQAQVVERRVAELLLSHAQHLRDALRVLRGDDPTEETRPGIEKRHWDVDRAFAKTWARDLGYGRQFRLALVLQNRFGFDRLLAHALADRFEMLVNQRRVLGEITAFARDRLGPMLGDEITEILITLNANRAKAVEDALLAFKLQYPIFAEALQRQHLERLARGMERRGYRSLLDQGVIGGEVAQALTEAAAERYPGIDRRPRLDTRVSAAALVSRVPMFASLSPEAQARICRGLRPRLVLPNERVVRKGDRGESMFFIASGAVRLSLPSGEEIELGSGDFFGELALITGRPRSTDVVALGFCQLLELGQPAFQGLLGEDEAMRRQIEAIAQQRLNATGKIESLATSVI